MTTCTIYASATEQAWKTYTTTSGRIPADIKLMKDQYDAFLAAAQAFDKLNDSLKSNETLSSKNDVSASNATFAMDTALTQIGNIIETFPAMDKATINKAAILDQANLSKTYKARQASDGEFAISLNNVLYTCQMLYAEAKYGALPDTSGIQASKSRPQSR